MLSPSNNFGASGFRLGSIQPGVFLRLLTVPLGIMAFSAGLALPSCGFVDEPSGGNGGEPTVSLEFDWPDGYELDRSTYMLKTAGQASVDALPYITRIELTISGDDMETKTVEVPLDTMEVDLTLTVGLKVFDVLVETNIGVEFTDSQTRALRAGVKNIITFVMEVNAPPVIERIELSDYTPVVGDMVTITAIAYDMDPDDALTYSWIGYDPNGVSKTFEGKSITVEVGPLGGKYTITLTVRDGHGGVARKTESVFVQGLVPASVVVMCDNLNPYHNVSYQCDCAAYDSAGNVLDKVIYDWEFITKGVTTRDFDAGPTVFRTGNAATENISCKVGDGAGNFTVGFITLNQSPYKVVVTWSNAGGKDIDLTVIVHDPAGNTWDSPSDGGGVLCGAPSPLTGPDYVYLGGAPITGNYTVDVMYADDCGSLLIPGDDSSYTVELVNSSGTVVGGNTANGTFLYWDLPGGTTHTNKLNFNF